MKLTISKDVFLTELKKQFNDYFAYLKIEFLEKSRSSAKKTNFPIITEKRIGELTTKLINQELEITPTMTVSELEDTFKQKLDLRIVVYRKSGKIWLETSATEHWSLFKQNQFGQLLGS